MLRTIRTHQMIDPGDHVLVAVSGGADSTALLLCLKRLSSKLNFSLTVAHLNHRLRGPESNADEAAVEQLCSRLDLPLMVESLTEEQAAAILSGNLEEKARIARQCFLKRSAKKSNTNKIALGHSQNDQAETVLLHFLRGSGPTGLSAIHPVTEGGLIRPLLECGRAEVEAYLQSNGVAFREDSSNRDLRYRRNRIRHECLPYLAKYFNPAIIETLAREAGIARQSTILINRLVMQHLEVLRRVRSDGMDIPAEEIARLDPALAKAVLRAAICETRGSLRGITSLHLDAILRLCTNTGGGRELLLPGGTVIRREFSKLVLQSALAPPAAGFLYPLSIPGRCAIPEAGVEYSAELKVPGEPPSRDNRACLDPETTPLQLWLRPRRKGDRYGGEGHRKVKKMLIDNRIERAARDILPLLTSNETVIWVPGFEPARHYKAKSLQDKCLVVTIKPL